MPLVRVLAVLCLAAASCLADTPICACDHSTKADFDNRYCGLCAVVEADTGTGPVVFIKDNSPLKPNRWLAVPRMHVGTKVQILTDLTPEARTILWTAAIERSKQIWGPRWGVALNGVASRGQCHLHIHIGKLIDGVEWGPFQEVDSPAEIPDPGPLGIWVHPGANGKLHVHVELSTETVLAR